MNEIVWFTTNIENPKYNPYSSQHPSTIPYSGIGKVVHIDLNHYRGIVVVDNATGCFLQMLLSDIHCPTKEEQKVYLAQLEVKL